MPTPEADTEMQKTTSKPVESLEAKLLPIVEGPTAKEKLKQLGARQFKRDELINSKKPAFYDLYLEKVKNGEVEAGSKLEISDKDFKKLSPGMQRYWELKKDAMDCVLCYRFGEWYVLYYDDLSLACKHLPNVCVTPHIGCKQMGFHSRELSNNV